MNKRQLYNELAQDLDRGTYIAFPEMERKLTIILTHIEKSIFVVNYELSNSDIKYLSDAGYKLQP